MLLLTTVATTLKEFKTTPAIKPKVSIPSTSTGVTSKTTGKTSGLAKDKGSHKKGSVFGLLSSKQELDEFALDSEVEGVTESVDPVTVAKPDQENQLLLDITCRPESH